MAVPLLLVLGPLLAEISLLLCNFIIILVEKMLLVELDQGPSFLLTKTVMVVATPLQAGQAAAVAGVDSSPPLHHAASDAQPSDWPHCDIGALSEFIP